MKKSVAVLATIFSGSALAHTGDHSGLWAGHFFSEPVHLSVWVLACCSLLLMMRRKGRRRS